MKCSICGGKMTLSQWNREKELEKKMKECGVYSLNKVMGDGNYCPNCTPMLKGLFLGEVPTGIKDFYEDIVKKNCVHVNISLPKLEEYIDLRLGIKSKFDFEPVQKMAENLVFNKREELDRIFGAEWIYSEKSKDMAAQKQNGNMVLAERFCAPDIIDETMEKTLANYSELESMSLESLFEISIIPVNNIVSYCLGDVIGDTENDTYAEIKLMFKNTEGNVESKILSGYFFEIFEKLIPEKGPNAKKTEVLQKSEDIRILENDTENVVYQKSSASQEIVISANMVEDIKHLKELLDLGLITQEEFNAKKRQILKL